MQTFYCSTRCCISKNITCVLLLLKAGADVNKEGFSFWDEEVTALLIAAADAFDRAVKILIQEGADVNKVPGWGNTAHPLMAALLSCKDPTGDSCKKCLELLLEAGADVNIECNGDTALHVAVYCGLSEAVDLLIRAGADVNKVPEYGCTPLIKASENDDVTPSSHHVKCMELLIDAGADVNATTPEGSALTTASGNVCDDSEGVQLLI